MKPGAIILFFLSIVLHVIPLQSNATKRFVREGYTRSGELNWNNASGDLFNILSISQPGDTIWVAKGTYKPTAGTDRYSSFLLKQGVVLQGGFKGNETYLYERVIGDNPTILSGDIDTVGNNDSYHVIQRYFGNLVLTSATVLDGFIIQDGRADSPNLDANSDGAAMYLINCSLTISNCKFISNYCSQNGAVIYLSNGSPTFTNCDFSSNTAGSVGAVFYLTGTGDVSITQCNFINNSSTFSSVLWAEAFIQVSISASIFKENKTKYLTALYFSTNYTENHKIDNCLFIQNFIEGSVTLSEPTTIFSENILLTVVNCNFYDSTALPGIQHAAVGGGGRYFNCIFQGNDHMVSGSSYIQIYNSIIQGGFQGCQNCPGSNGNVDPLFSNISDLDGPDDILGTADDGMRLSAYSAGIDAGLDSLFTSPDITGASHGLDEGIDIGAYEGGVCIGTVSSRLYVDSSVSGGNGSGDSWQNAIADLKLALNVAKSCSGVTEIWTAKGTYKPTSTSDRNRYFSMLNGVSIYGGFQGNETALNQRNHRKYITTLSGNIDKTGNADSYNVIKNLNLNSTAQLNGFTITNANNEIGQGGAVYNTKSSPVFKFCIFKNNFTSYSGGGMYNNLNSSPLVLNCVFANNTATGGGGMFNFQNSNPVLRNCVLVNNTSLANGGGMSNGSNSNPTLINCNIVSNIATGNGGGLYNVAYTNPVITNCIFWSNGGTNKEIVNATVTDIPVVSYSDVQGGYSPCTSCADYNIAPQFLKDFNWAGADSVYGTVDDEMHLGNLSPCLNTGNSAVVVDSLDVAGQPRIQNGTVNIGAYENMYLITLNSGNWNNPTNWNYQRVPLASDLVYIKAGHVIQLNQPNGVCKSILVQPGAKLNLVLPGTLQVQ